MPSSRPRPAAPDAATRPHQYRHLRVDRDGAVLRVRLDRPDVHNALDGALIEDLHSCFAAAGRGEGSGGEAGRGESEGGGGVRVVVLSGEGPSFCAGADLAWLRRIAGWTHDAHVEDARRLFDALAALDACAVPLVARVHGAVFGGGMGLLACCDVVVAAGDARFGFTEAKLGLLPAVISPFVVAKIGQSHARALFTTAERFDAEHALRIGLAHQVVPAAALDAAVDAVVAEVLTSAPGAAAEARRLVARVAGSSPGSVRDEVAALTARLRTAPEAQEGIAAFLEKRRPRWAKVR